MASRYSRLTEGKLQFDFIQSEMRHLVKHFHQKYMEPFPKKILKTPKEIKIVSVDIDLFCCCSVPDVKGLGPWIALMSVISGIYRNVKVSMVKKYQGGSCTPARNVKPKLPQDY